MTSILRACKKFRILASWQINVGKAASLAEHWEGKKQGNALLLSGLFLWRKRKRRQRLVAPGFLGSAPMGVRGTSGAAGAALFGCLCWAPSPGFFLQPCVTSNYHSMQRSRK